MRFKELVELIKTDLERFEQTYALRGQKFSKRRAFWESILFKAGFQGVLLYRFSHWLFKKKFNYLAWFVTRLNILLTGAEIEYNVEIGPGMFIAHPVGVVIGRGTIIGSGVTIFQGVTFGASNWNPNLITKFPRIGNNCFFFANSTIVGDISIGNECIVAANTQVSTDMEDGSFANGVPAKIYPNKGKEYINSWSKEKFN